MRHIKCAFCSTSSLLDGIVDLEVRTSGRGSNFATLWSKQSVLYRPLTCGIRTPAPGNTPRFKPPKGQNLRKELRHERKALAGRYYQHLSGHTATGDYLQQDSPAAAGQTLVVRPGRETPRHRLFVICEAWKPQIRKTWVRATGGYSREHPERPCSLMTRERRKRFCPSL